MDLATDVYVKRANGTVPTKKSIDTERFWTKVQITEWTFSLFLFTLSLSIVLAKLCINYGGFLQAQSHVIYKAPSIAVFSNISNSFSIPGMPSLPEISINKLSVASETLANISSQYEDVTNTVISVTNTYGQLIRAALSGLMMIGFTWFIIYMDSCIPGVNPAFPLSPSKQRQAQASKLQINYIVGVLNGILIFLYMCL